MRIFGEWKFKEVFETYGKSQNVEVLKVSNNATKLFEAGIRKLDKGILIQSLHFKLAVTNWLRNTCFTHDLPTSCAN